MNLLNYIVDEDYKNIESTNNISYEPEEMYVLKFYGKAYCIKGGAIELHTKFRNVTPEKIADEVLNSTVADVQNTEIIVVGYEAKAIGFLVDKSFMQKPKNKDTNIINIMYEDAISNEPNNTHISFAKKNWILVMLKNLDSFDLKKEMDEFVMIEETPEPNNVKSSWFSIW